MKNLFLIGFVFLLGCSHENIQSLRSVSSSDIKSEKIEILDPVQKNGFVKLKLGHSNDLAALKKILADTLSNEDSLAETQKLNSDYFKSVKWAGKLTDQLIELNLNPNEMSSNPLFTDLINVLNALKNRFVNPFQEKVELLALPFIAAKYTYSPEIQIPYNVNIDSPQRAPIDANQVSAEIERPRLLNPDQIICDYDKPKDGWGYKAGFKVRCDGRKLKIKFGNEVLSGPFNSRIFRTLGYLTPRIDNITNFRMKYDRRYFTEFNSQKDVNVDIKLLGVKLKTISTKKPHDPFSYIKNVTLKNGSLLPAESFKNKLILQGQFDVTFESEIDFLTFNEGSVTENLDVIGVGPWSFEEPNHQKNPLVHQGIILSAWVGNSDIHMANNLLIIEKSTDKKSAVILPIFVDVGYGLGRTDSAFRSSSSNVDKMNWTISEPATTNNDNQSPENNKVRLSGYTSQQYNTLLTRLKFEDVYAALRNICRLDHDQIKTALLQAGASEATAQLGTSKLLHRRSKLIHDFGIQAQFAACYEPQKKIQ